MRPGAVTPRLDAAAATLALSAALVGKPAQPWMLIGDATGTRVECADVTLALELAGPIDDPELKLRLRSDTVRLVLDLSDGDGLLQELLGDQPQSVQGGGSVIWSSKAGLSFEGQASLKLVVPVHQDFGPAQVSQLTVAISAAGGGVQLAAGVTGSASLGPIGATVQDVGVALKLAPAAPPGQGTFGSLDAGFGFKPPTGLGVELDAPAMTGGGFLAHQDSQYAGALDLSLLGTRSRRSG